MLNKIHTEYQTYTASQQKIAEYLTRHLEDAFVLSATELAQRVEVSEATITRFINRLGFSGFSEFKRAMGRSVLQGMTTTEKLAESAETLQPSKSVLTEILKGDISNIRSITDKISDKRFREAVGKLSSARSIYVLGLRTSHALALYLAFNLRFFLKSVENHLLCVYSCLQVLQHIRKLKGYFFFSKFSYVQFRATEVHIFASTHVHFCRTQQIVCAVVQTVVRQ